MVSHLVPALGKDQLRGAEAQEHRRRRRTRSESPQEEPGRLWEGHPPAIEHDGRDGCIKLRQREGLWLEGEPDLPEQHQRLPLSPRLRAPELRQGLPWRLLAHHSHLKAPTAQEEDTESQEESTD